MNIQTVIYAFLLLGVLLAGCANQGNVKQSTIILGAIFPVTGDASSVGVPIVHQLMLTIDEVNVAGGIHGKKIEIKLEDGKCNPKDGATAAQKLIEVDKVPVIFGGGCSGEMLGAAPIAEANKVILISPSATSPDITKAGDYIFRTAPSDAYAGKVAAEKAIGMGYKKAAVIHETTDYAQGLAKVFDDVFTAQGGAVLVNEGYATLDTDFKTQILKIKEAEVDVVYIVPQSPAKGLQLLKQINEEGVTSQLLASDALIGREIIKEHGNEMGGLIGIEAAFDENAPIAKKALADFRKKYGEPPFPGYQMMTRDAVYLVVNAIKKDGLDKDKIKADLYATKDWEGAIGKITMDSNGEPLLGYSVKQVKNGMLVEIQ